MVGPPRGLHLEVPLPGLNALHLAELYSDAELLRLGEACFKEFRARDGVVSQVVLNMLGVMGTPPGTMEEQYPEVVAGEVYAGLQASRAGAYDDAVEGRLRDYSTFLFQGSSSFFTLVRRC